MQIPDWLKSLFGSLLGSVAAEATGLTPDGSVSASVTIPFGGPDNTAPAADVLARGWSKSISDCHPRIRAAWPIVQQAFIAAHPDCTFRVDYTWRSKEFQFDLFKLGRTLTDGQWVVTDKSKIVTDKNGDVPSHHNVYPSQAVDVYIVRGGLIVWPSASSASVCALYTELGQLWEQQGLVSGAVWRFGWKDWPHTQVDYEIL